MCSVSNVGDYWKDTSLPSRPYWPAVVTQPSEISRVEFDQLKRDLEELKKLLLAAKKYDEAMGEPDCAMDEKVALIKKLAKLAGVDMGEVFK